jgi:hypothetical protein
MSMRKLAMCPTCNFRGEFELLGEQHWPPEVAGKLGLPPVIRLWSCPHCMSTISEPDLLPFQAATDTQPNAGNNNAVLQFSVTRLMQSVPVDQQKNG